MNKILCLSACLFASAANAGFITTFSDRATFDAAAGSTTLENFTSTSHFPIPGGSLSSTSSFGSLSAGDIQSGATYTTPVGSGNYFNIDAGGGFTGGFLDGFNPADRDLTITYSPLISAFGFDTNSLMNDFDITVNFLSGASYNANFTGISSMKFFGFQSDAADIQSVLISGNNSSFGFAIDNHSFGGDVSAVPEPSSLALLALGLVGLTFNRKRK
ncbi:PEP-CTERM sorting domain-containing protein [Dasania marina]|uniref:PEP-CTERM sorting domain-containing protein n=1 Tax=Dasania marina TaxID=471499 RepID=UPI0030DD2A5F|tara:strand:+ start:16837 stop:17484 length:648 start_codon:yes stop_codon:yes gene_type:complete